MTTVMDRATSDTIAAIESALQRRRARKKGAELLFACLVHQDEHASAQWNPDKKVWKCYACGAGGGWTNLAELLGIPVPKRTRITLEDLALDKDLPAAFLRKLGLENLDRGGVGIPYRDATGTQLHVKTRTALRAKDGSWWPKGQPLMAYGLDRWAAATRAQGYGIIGEGESDGWSAWHHDLPYLGIPGADSAKVLQAEHIAAVPRLYILQEPDQGGTTLVEGARRRFIALRWPGEAFVFNCGSVKDLCDLHRLSCEGLPAALEALLADAQPLALSIDPGIAPTPGNNGTNGTNGLITVVDVEAEQVAWLWPRRIPLGKVTVLEGDPDQGKSLTTLDLAARGSKGIGLPDGTRSDVVGPWSTILMTAEDGLADTVRPRLEAAGADLNLIHVLEGVPGEEGELTPPELPRDLPHLRRAIQSKSAKLVIIDVLLAYLSSDVKALADQDIRRALRPLAKLAEELGVAVIVLRHLTKGGGANPMYRGGGAIGLGGAARSVLLAGNDPKVPGRHLLARVKGNLAPPYPTLAYEILADGQNRPFLRWGGESSTSAVEILAAAEEDARDAMTDRSVEEMFLAEVLAQGERPAVDIRKEAEKLGLKYKSVWRVSGKLNVRRRREGFGPDSQWLWSLPIDSIDAIDVGGRNNGRINGATNGHVVSETVPEGDLPWR